MQLTPEGRAFCERSARILADIDEAEQQAAGTAPRGRVRVNANVAFGQHYLLPLRDGSGNPFPPKAYEGLAPTECFGAATSFLTVASGRAAAQGGRDRASIHHHA